MTLYSDGTYRMPPTAYGLLGVQLTPTDSGDWEVIYLDYVPPASTATARSHG